MENRDKVIVAAVAAAYIATGAGVVAAYDDKYNVDPGTAAITDEVVERIENGEKVEVTCKSDGDCEVTN